QPGCSTSTLMPSGASWFCRIFDPMFRADLDIEYAYSALRQQSPIDPASEDTLTMSLRFPLRTSGKPYLMTRRGATELTSNVRAKIDKSKSSIVGRVPSR